MTSETKPNRLRRTREQCGLSLTQAIRMLGWQGTGLLEEIEAGALHLATDEDLRALAKVYGCSVAWLRGETAELSAENEALLRDVEHTGDRAVVREFMEMISTQDPGTPPRGPLRLCDVAAKREASAASAVPTASKRSYVKRQRQTRDHHCHWPGCTTPVPPAMWGCKAHWFKLPKALRDRIWAAYAPGQEVDMTPSAEYLQVADDVQQWIRANAAGAPR